MKAAAFRSWEDELMDKFEEFGHRIDEELNRFRRFMEEEVAPETERRGAIFLREVSDKLSDAAKKLEARHASRVTTNEPKLQA
ncbi:MAG TPA: hypothetical protein VE545_08035 [Candidatus Dormibacteraeota bacterium]|nr:hypothetical protein [Candidatus Dormibacteraeota bacterium]